METLKEKCRTQQEKFNYRLNINKPILVHVDGRAFSSMVKKRFAEPFDDKFISIMDKIAVELCSKVQGARIAYVQSDEISLLLLKNNPESDIFFGGRLCKIQSIIASMATAVFIREYMKLWNKNTEEEFPLFNFDCKAWTVDEPNDVITWFLFRNIDCIRNSKNQTARTYLSHDKLLNLNADEQIKLLKEKLNIDWHSFPNPWKYGRLITHDWVEHQMNGNIYDRLTWMIKEGMDLTVPRNREIFANMIEIFPE